MFESFKENYPSNKTKEVFDASLNKVIAALSIVPAARGLVDTVLVQFTDGTGIKIYDDGQSCCEHRYLVGDDRLSEFTGAILLDIEVADAPNVGAGYDRHEVQFLRLHTDKGIVVFSNHNEHNGYYGGFLIQIDEA